MDLQQLHAALHLDDEDHYFMFNMKDQHALARDYCFEQDLKKKWGASSGAIKTWTLGGWDQKGNPIFSAYLGGQWWKEAWYNKDGSHLGFDVSCVEYPLNKAWYHAEYHVITVPDVKLCLKKGAREKIQQEIKRLSK